jgi:hypothetical protein
MPLKEVVGGIYSLQPLPSRWLFLLAMGTPDSPVVHQTGTVHCPVRATSARPLRFGAIDRWNPLSCSCTGQSSALWLRSRPLALGYRWSAGSPDMSGAHRAVQWIIVERALRKPESGLFAWSSAWCTRHCLVRHWQHTLKSFAPNLFKSPT